MRSFVALGLSAILLAAGAFACASLSDATSAGVFEPGQRDGDAATSGSAPPENADLAALDNGLIVVHAAQGGAFRLCFGAELDRLPLPDSTVMPEANVVGVDVGTAVRLDPLRGAPGEVYLFDEALIRAYYGPGAGSPPSCEQLLANQTLGNIAVTVGSVDDDLSRGVHMLAITGCPGETPIRKYSAAQCGPTYDPVKGNLQVVHMPLQGYARGSQKELPVQVIHLSRALESARGGRALSVSFATLAGGGKAPVTVAGNLGLLEAPQPSAPSPLPLDPEDAGVFASVGFRVELGAALDGGADAGPTKLFDQSLASVQEMSAPRDVPPPYYAKASNYVLLLLGEPTLADGGAITDEFRRLHLLAVPVIEPKPDAGADGGEPDGSL